MPRYHKLYTRYKFLAGMIDSRVCVEFRRLSDVREPIVSESVDRVLPHAPVSLSYEPKIITVVSQPRPYSPTIPLFLFWLEFFLSL